MNENNNLLQPLVANNYGKFVYNPLEEREKKNMQIIKFRTIFPYMVEESGTPYWEAAS